MGFIHIATIPYDKQFDTPLLLLMVFADSLLYLSTNLETTDL